MNYAKLVAYFTLLDGVRAYGSISLPAAAPILLEQTFTELDRRSALDVAIKWWATFRENVAPAERALLVVYA
jgi:hypothetical protein